MIAYALAVLVPAGRLSGSLPALQGALQLPLWPVGACYQAGALGTFTWAEAVAVPLVLLEIAAVALVAGQRLGRRGVVLAA